ncbi:unnamed protein product [Paramecium octaurelia]|uniref:Uncharacterized protein n=1 Tax=Paramecium octaurelia TaxID=43137 RepID=A0A8S1WX21_PAROT|nr:unnamed protein product [Paramecium octaurelia]
MILDYPFIQKNEIDRYNKEQPNPKLPDNISTVMTIQSNLQLSISLLNQTLFISRIENGS